MKMKKLVLALAAIALAVGVQAASVSWATGQLFSPSDATGTKGTGATYAIRNATGDTLSWYVFAGLDSTDYTAAATAGNVYGWLTTAPESGSKLTPASGQGTVNNANAQMISSEAFGNGETVNWAAVIVYTDADGVTWYTEAYDSLVTDAAGGLSAVSNIGKNVATWTKVSGGSGDVPEPTSALLLIVGGALLALRRKQK